MYLMTEATIARRLTQLKNELMQHPHKQELLQLVQEQLKDDTHVLSSCGTPGHGEAHQ